MDGGSYQTAADARRFASRRGLCGSVDVLAVGSFGTVGETPVLPVPVAAAVFTGRVAAEGVAVSDTFRGADRRNGDASDAAARRKRHGERNDRGNGSRACGAAFGVRRAAAPDNAPQAAFGPTEAFSLHKNRRPTRNAYIPAQRVDRQRKSSQRAGHRPSRASDRASRRSSAAADSVSKAVRRRNSVRRTAAFGHAAGIRKRSGRLHLRRLAGADRKGAGDPAGEPFTV